MSFSITVREATKQAALDAVALKMKDVVQAQPVHAADEGAVNAAAAAYVGIVADDEGKDVALSISGSLSWVGNGNEQSITGSSISLYVSTPDRV